jgi:hypothetical protein
VPARWPWRSLHLLAYVNLISACNVEMTHAIGLPMTSSRFRRLLCPRSQSRLLVWHAESQVSCEGCLRSWQRALEEHKPKGDV